jgi:ribosomal protein L35
MTKCLKTHKWAQKRFKITKKKKVLFSKACNNHLLTNKWKSNKKKPYWKNLHKSYVKSILDLLPYN